MTQGKSVCSRIRNARNSLDNAERSFRSNQEVRGELDLMLAEAELDNLRQKRTGLFSWTRHVLAVCLAVLLLAAGGLGWWWASAYGGKVTNASGLTRVSVAEKQADTVGKAAPSASVSVSPGQKQEFAASETTVSARKTTELSERPALQVAPKAKKNDGIRLSSGQMHQLIRSGKQELGNIR